MPWMLSFLAPHRGRVSLLAVLLLLEIGLGALQPWPLAIAIDHVLGGAVVPAERIQSHRRPADTTAIGTCC